MNFKLHLAGLMACLALSSFGGAINLDERYQGVLIYQSIEPVGRDHPLRALCLKETVIYRITFTPEFLNLLENDESAGAIISTAAFDSSPRGDKSATEWVNPLWIVQTPLLIRGDWRCLALGTDFEREAVMTFKLGGILRWYFALASQPPFVWNWQPQWTWVDETFYWQDGYLADGDDTGTYHFDNAARLLYASACGEEEVGFWDHLVPAEAQYVLGDYTFLGMFLHQDEGTHGATIPVYDYRHGNWFACKYAIIP